LLLNDNEESDDIEAFAQIKRDEDAALNELANA
jgi:hypothetical protein